MSADVIALLAHRWQTTPQGVAEKIGGILQRRGLIDPGSMQVYEGDEANAHAEILKPPKWLVLGVTDDNRIAVLDEQDRPLLWLDDRSLES